MVVVLEGAKRTEVVRLEAFIGIKGPGLVVNCLEDEGILITPVLNPSQDFS